MSTSVAGDLAVRLRRAHPRTVSEAEQDPRAQYRELPAPLRPEELVETSDVSPPMPAETPLQEVWRVALFGPGTP